MNWPLLQNSLWLSGVTTALAVGLGYFAALWLAALDRRWRNRLLLGAVIALVLPPFLVSNCWLDLLGATGKWRAWLPVNLYSIGGAAAILILLYWPITTLLVVGAWHQLEASQLEADPALRGAGLIRWLLWPTSRAAAGQAAVLTFVLALNNFTVPAILQVKVFPAEVWLRFSTNLRPVEALAVGWPLVAAPILLLLLLRRAEISWPRGEGPATAQAVRRQLGAAWFAASGAVTAGLLVLSVGLPLGQVVSGAPT